MFTKSIRRGVGSYFQLNEMGQVPFPGTCLNLTSKYVCPEDQLAIPSEDTLAIIVCGHRCTYKVFQFGAIELCMRHLAGSAG